MTQPCRIRERNGVYKDTQQMIDDTQDTLRAETQGELDDDLWVNEDPVDEGSQSPSERVLHYLNLQRASYN